MHTCLRVLTITLSALLALPAAQAADDEAFWALLKEGGKVVVMRHAQTDAGIGDPAGFRLEDCSTQRNLSAQGRADAVRIGARFRNHGIQLGAVLSSHWCRCLDTARLAFGRVTPSPMLDSVFDQYAPSETAKTREVLAWLGGRVRPGSRANVVLVTHAVNIDALAGVSLASGEMAVATLDGPRKLKVLARATPGR